MERWGQIKAAGPKITWISTSILLNPYRRAEMELPEFGTRTEKLFHPCANPGS